MINRYTHERYTFDDDQHGFTLIELMIAMVAASLLLGMAFSVYTRLSVSYRAQSDVSALQSSLSAASSQITGPIRAVGHKIPDGFAVNGVGTVPALVVQNDTDASDTTFSTDEIRVYYADASASARVLSSPAPTGSAVTVDDRDTFEVEELVLITNPRPPVVMTAGQAPVVGYDACLVQITGIAGTSPAVFEFAPILPFNSANNAHCTSALDMSRSISPMIYRFGARGIRIDPDVSKRQTGVLQTSASGGLIAGDWQLMGVGFTNLQVAVRYAEGSDAVDADGDGDPTRDWYSGTQMPSVSAVPLSINVSLEIRTFKELDIVPSSATPSFVEEGSDPDHNALGDWDSQPLFGVSDGARPTQYRGDHIYRSQTVRIDLRNLGVGQ